MKRDNIAVPPPLRWLLILATALVLCAVVGYRPFPAIDDLSKIPRAWSALDPSLYGRDFFIQQYLQYNPLWPALVWLLQHSVGLATGLWALTLMLAVATVVATDRMLRTLSGEAWLLPLVAVLALGGVVQGLGRGSYDGVFGASFHMQWLALCLGLWAYALFLQARYWSAGLLISIVFYVHPVVAAQVLGVLLFAALFTGKAGFSNLLRLLAVPLLLATPFILWLLLKTSPSTPLGESAGQLIREGYLFRAPHEYDLSDTPSFLGWLFAVFIAAGLAGLLTPHRLNKGPNTPARRLAGLLWGHLLLLGLAVALQTEWLSPEWPYSWLLPYKLHLTRTTPLLLVLAGVAFVAAFKPGREPPGGQSGGLRLHWVFYWAMWALLLVTMAAFQVRWQGLVIALLALAAGSMIVRHWLSWPWLVVPWLSLAGAAGYTLLHSDQLQRVPSPEEAMLYQWAKTDTGKDAMFIIPPGMQDFRFYARRSIYVDFKMFPNAMPWLVAEWRRRLEQVAAPDKLALQGRGWPVVPEWDRCYANRNVPSRIADLLAQTGADFLVWDNRGLLMPPFVPVDREPDSRLEVAFSDGRFVVYRRASGRVTGSSEHHD